MVQEIAKGDYLSDDKRSGRPGVSEEKVEQVSEFFQQNPSKSVRREP